MARSQETITACVLTLSSKSSNRPSREATQMNYKSDSESVIQEIRKKKEKLFSLHRSFCDSSPDGLVT